MGIGLDSAHAVAKVMSTYVYNMDKAYKRLES